MLREEERGGVAGVNALGQQGGGVPCAGGWVT